MTGELAGKVALVTGGARGIGRAIAERLLAEGAGVVITARAKDAVEEAAHALGCHALVADVTDSDSLQSAFNAAGGIDILVNNAGEALALPFQKTSLEDWNRIIAINLTGTFLATRLALPGMTQRRWGRVVNIASTAGLKAYQYTAAYCAAKHGIIGLTRALALEIARSGVTVNAVCPGFTETDMARNAIAVIETQTGRNAAEARAALERFNPQNRLTDPAEVAAAVAFLCRPEAHGVTGQSLIISGGEVM
ncbi:MAG TPA: SDR family NAD(P)-dependent oxidoreductase [Stellaceae bacterium]|nr:SDR family NAD(P)-dependent oxidoreductase [Stellaceae bacterium]